MIGTCLGYMLLNKLYPWVKLYQCHRNHKNDFLPKDGIRVDLKAVEMDLFQVNISLHENRISPDTARL